MTATPEKQSERLQVVLARFGLASRRGVVSMIEGGGITVNGEVIREKGHRVLPTDKIVANGQELSTEAPTKRYFILNKPKGVMTTLQDPHADKTVGDFFSGVPERLFPVGRLDRDTTGLILMTNDGELMFRLTHPKFGVKKKYRAIVEGLVTDEEVKRLERGVRLEEGMTAPCNIKIDKRTPKETHLYVSLHEGKKRQIRRIFDEVGHWVKDLVRLSYGPLDLGDLPVGQKRELRPEEVKTLQTAGGLGQADKSRTARKSRKIVRG